jgi:hypothetical protein
MIRASFNEGWQMRPKVNPFAELSGTKALYRPVTLPHDAMIERERAVPAGEITMDGGAGAYFPGGAYEYRKTFSVPEKYRGKRILFEFEGIYRDAVVYVNGDYAGQRPFGYSHFFIDADRFPAGASSRPTYRRDLFPNRIILGTETFPTRIDGNWRLVKQYGHGVRAGRTPRDRLPRWHRNRPPHSALRDRPGAAARRGRPTGHHGQRRRPRVHHPHPDGPGRHPPHRGRPPGARGRLRCGRPARLRQRGPVH